MVFLATILTLQEVRLKDQHVELLQTKIDSITQYNSKPYFRQALKRLAALNAENANVICDYILAEQTDINIKESTKEGKIKVLIWLSNYLANKPFSQMTKQDILSYLNSLKRPYQKNYQRLVGQKKKNITPEPIPSGKVLKNYWLMMIAALLITQSSNRL
jgi:hypothetical protein